MFKKIARWFKNLFKKKSEPVQTKPAPKPEPSPGDDDNKSYQFEWNNKEFDKYLVDALKKSKLLASKPKDKEEFGPEPDPIWFWGKILAKMAYYESKWKPETKYQENFKDRNGKYIVSRGLFQLSIESGRGYDRSLKDEQSLHDPKVNIELAVKIMEKLVGDNDRIAGKVSGKWQGGARYWSVLRGSRDYTAKALAAIKAVNQIPEPPVRDNDDVDKPDDGGQHPEYPKDKEDLWYPKAIKSEHKMRTRGYYKKKYPQGAVVHFTAGRSRKKSEGGSRNPSTHLDQGKRGVRSAADKGSYAYFVIDRDGNVHQNFPLNRWGYHAGTSAWKGLSGSVSDELVGIEIQNAGTLKDYWKDGSGKKHKCPEGYLAAWFSRPDRGDKLFNKETECRYSSGEDNIAKGWYHKYSTEQEIALTELMIWLKRNNPDVFSTELILGHDEVAGPKGIGRWRKVDPGASLSMTMTEFRYKVWREYSNRYE